MVQQLRDLFFFPFYPNFFLKNKFLFDSTLFIGDDFFILFFDEVGRAVYLV